MCGIGGVKFGPGAGRLADEGRLESLRRALRHRGPDGEGQWVSPDRRLALVHTRLAIVDLSETGAQPMASPCGRWQIAFNGEIYNHVELRQELEARGEVFRGTSDTEVLLRLLMREGAAALRRLDGMFAIALHDSRTGELLLARDPLGEKPLYYRTGASFVAFASEARALVAAGLASTSPDLAGLGFLLRQGSIPPPRTHLEDVRFLPPGHLLRVGDDGTASAPERWWSLPFLPEERCLDDADEAERRVDEALRRSVRRRLRSDVPVACFLSGGVDSSVLAALLVEEGARDLATFTVTLPGQGGDEAEAAGTIARHLGTRHREIPLELGENGDWLDDALAAMDVPSIDGPNTWLVSRAVRREGFKVACSGLGGDELFFGYPSFTRVPRARALAAPLAPLRPFRRALRPLMAALPARPRFGRLVDAAMSGGSVAALWFAQRGLLSEAEVAELLAEAGRVPLDQVDAIGRLEQLACPAGLATARQVSFYELSAYMHDQLLRDSDAMSMAHALELRVPLIGLPVIEAVGSLSSRVLAGDRPKAVLRRIASRHLPAEIIARPKQGFTLNWTDLLRGRPAPADATARGILVPGAWERQRARVADGRAGFAWRFVLDVVCRNVGAAERSPGSRATIEEGVSSRSDSPARSADDADQFD